MQFDIIDNSKEVLTEFAKKVSQILWAIGATAEGYAKKGSPVDTGRLRNNISHVEEDNATYIGTNVEYAPYQELGTSKQPGKHFLRDAAANHNDEYKAIAENILKQ